MASYYSLDRTALLKILLHSLKFPTSPVNGFLLGEERKEAAHPSASPPTTPREATRRVLHILDAIPVSHNYLTLTMPVEAALVQLQEHCKLQGNVRIVGYYQCNERLDDSDLGESGKRIASKVEAAFPGSVALVVRLILSILSEFIHSSERALCAIILDFPFNSNLAHSSLGHAPLQFKLFFI